MKVHLYVSTETITVVIIIIFYDNYLQLYSHGKTTVIIVFPSVIYLKHKFINAEFLWK